MQRNNLEKLLQMSRVERIKYIASLEREVLENYIYLAKALKENHSKLDLLEDLTRQKTKLEQAWKDQVLHLIFSLYDNLKQENPGEPKESKNIFKTVDVFKQTQDEAQALRLILEEKEKMIEKLKRDNKLIQKNYYNLKEDYDRNNQLLKEMSSENISLTIIAEIIKKYDNKSYGYFSKTPEALHALKKLCLYTQKPYLTKSDVRACLHDPKNLFDHPRLPSSKLTNREKLICELSRLFREKSGAIPELKFK